MERPQRRPRLSRVHDRRGNNVDRRNRKLWMLRTWNPELAPWICKCVHCSTDLEYTTVQADRITPGTSYRRENIQPSCADCNRARGNDVNWVHPNRQSIALPAAA